MYKRVLVPLDGSPLAETAIPHASLIASSLGAQLGMIRVTTLRFIQDAQGSGYVVEESADRDEAESYLRAWQERLRGEGLDVSYRVVGGNVAEEIVRHAADSQTDLIVMSTHGRTASRLWAYGSVAYAVLRAAPCCVLVVRPALAGVERPGGQGDHEV